ncbi:MAG TPA: HGGxSTG domain-containing protein, partial [Roseiarcus sp.]
GRCRVHGGASTGPKSPEGKARVVAAMVEGRRKWAEQRRTEGRRFTAGRKGGDAWVTEAMRERAFPIQIWEACRLRLRLQVFDFDGTATPA